MRSMRKATEQEAREWLKKNKPMIELAEYGGSFGSKSKFCCKKKSCGYVWSTTFFSLKNSIGNGCPLCSKVARISKNDVKEWLQKNTMIELVHYGGSVSSKSLFRCKRKGCGYKWSTSFGSIKYDRHGCPKCAGNAVISEEYARHWLCKHRPDLELVKWGGSSCASSIFRCLNDGCGHEWSTTFDNIKRRRSSRCKKCIGLLKISRDDCVRWLAVNKPDIVLVDWGGSGSSRSTFCCKVCGKTWITSLLNIKQGTGCPECAHVHIGEKCTKALDEVVLWLKNNRPHLRLLDYCGRVRGKSVFYCLKHNVTWKTSFDSIQHCGGCSMCRSDSIREKLRVPETVVRNQLKFRHDIELVEYSGYAVKYKSLFRCLQCGYVWNTLASVVVLGGGCPVCNGSGKHYMYDDMHFHSSWEIIFYMYWKFCKHKKLHRNPQTQGSGYWIPYDRGRREFHPDFITANHRLIEIKPENGGIDREHRAKRRASKKCGRKVYWYGYREINPMKEWLIKHGYDWEQYRVNDKKNKPKVKKQNKSDECEESCCCGKA